MEDDFLLTACQSHGPTNLSYQFITFTVIMSALNTDVLCFQVHSTEQPGMGMFLEAKAKQIQTPRMKVLQTQEQHWNQDLGPTYTGIHLWQQMLFTAFYLIQDPGHNYVSENESCYWDTPLPLTPIRADLKQGR